LATEGLARPEGRNQTKKLKCKTQNFGIPASRDNSLLSKQLRQPCRKNTHKKQEIERLYYGFLFTTKDTEGHEEKQ